MSFQRALEKLVEKSFSPAASAKGLEKIILKATLALIRFSYGLQKLFYGKPIPREKYIKSTRIPKNPLDLGIIPILRILASIDYCNLLTWLASRTNLGRFDPNNPPPNDAPKLVRTKWKIQKTAYDAQKKIDDFEGRYADNTNPNSKVGLFRLVSQLEQILTEDFKKAIDSTGELGTTADVDALINAFPQFRVANSYLRDSFAFFRRYTDYRQISNPEYQRILAKVQKIRQVLILIQSINTPAALLSTLAFSGIAPGILEQIKRIEKLIRPERALPFLRRVLETLRNIQKICQAILNFIQIAQLIITVVTILIRVIRIIIQFLKLLPVPNAFTTVGITTTFSDAVNIIKEKGPTTFEKRLNQVVLFLLTLQMLLMVILPILNEIIFNLTRIIATLEGCRYMDQKLLQDLKGVRDQLQDSADRMYLFLKNKENNDSSSGNSNPNLTPIDQILANPGDLDTTGISAALGVPPPPVANRGGSRGRGATSSGVPSSGQGSANQTQREQAIADLKKKNQDVGIPDVVISAIETAFANSEPSQPGKNITNPVGKIGEYTIQIITEEVVEETFGLKRRYGVALNNKGEKIVQSIPTYASDSQIIIKEVQQLLLSKGLVKLNFSLYDPDQENTLKEATSYLFNRDLNWENFPGLSNRFRARLGIDANGKRIPANGIINNGQATSNDIGGVNSAAINSANSNVSGINKSIGNTQGIITGDNTNIQSLGSESTLGEGYFNDDLNLPVDALNIPGVEDYQVNQFEGFDVPNLELENIMLDEFEIDAPENENENDALGLNAFVNKLKGGKKLRRRMRKIMAKKLAKLKTDMQSADPQGKYGTNVGNKVAAGSEKLAPEADTSKVDLQNGAVAYKGVITETQKIVTTEKNSRGEIITYVSYKTVEIASLELRADDSELARQKLIEKYDPKEEKAYSYTVTAI